MNINLQLKAQLTRNAANELRAADYGIVTIGNVEVHKAASGYSARPYVYWLNGVPYRNPLQAAHFALRAQG